MSYPPIVYPILLDWPALTPFLAANLAVSAFVAAVIVALVVSNPNRLLRPALALAVAINLIFQWPLVLLSDQILTSLHHPWLFGLYAHLPVSASILFVASTPGLDRAKHADAAAAFDPRSAWSIAALLAVFVAVFLARVPFDCTALYASIIDPAAGLLAREVTIKFAGSAIATSAYGAVANSVAPTMVGMLFLLQLRLVQRRKWIVAGLALLSVLPCVAAVLLGGAKGLLVPTFMVGIFAALGAGRSPSMRISAVGAAVAVLMISMVTLELARERDGRIVDYDFNSCAARLGHTTEGIELLQSIAQGGLGLSAERIQWYLGEAAVKAVAAPPRRPPLDRAGSYFNSLIQRAFVTPLQVASWHQLFVEQHGSPGARVLPLAKYLFGSAVDITSLVYQAYGVQFSGGDRTITSTAPTSFIFAYPSYFGWVGMLTVIGVILALDVLMSKASRGLPTGNAFIAGGLSAVICYNLLTSDFYTTMISHGGAVAVLIVLLMRLTHSFGRPTTANVVESG